MMPALTTPVSVGQMPFSLSVGDGIVSLGSCFADEMAVRLSDGGFQVEQNPFGTLYNPASVAAALERIIDDREITEADLVQHDGLWHSWHHHGSFSRQTAEECLDVCNTRIHLAHQALQRAQLLVVTFGTAWVFELSSQSLPATDQRASNSVIVANCHKLPPSWFNRRMMSVDEIVSLWRPIIEKLSVFHPSLAMLFTVSPIRHMADGAHGNQVSKATLLLAVDSLSTVKLGLPVGYFPAYEIVLDELRDYRFYGPDMVHPSALAADIVCDRFEQSCMSPATRQQAHNNRKAAKRSRHIPLR